MADQAHQQQQQNPAPQRQGEPQREEEPINVSALVEEAKKGGLSAHLRGELEHMTPRALARFLEALGDDEKLAPVRDAAKEVKDQKDTRKERTPRSTDAMTDAKQEGGALVKGEKEAEGQLAEAKSRWGDDGGAGGSAHVEAGQGEASLRGEAAWSRDQGVTLSGNAGASVTVVGGGVEIHTKPIPFDIAGEQFVTRFRFGVDAGVLAESKGKIEVNANPNAQGVEAGISGFAGAKVSANASAALDWNKKSGAAYAGEAAANAQRFLGSWIPQPVLGNIPVDRLQELLRFVLPYVVGGDAGDTMVLAASAKGEGSAGAGAAASLAGGLEGGVVHCHGRFGVTFGLGAGADLDVELGLVDGMRMLGVMAFKGLDRIGEHLKPAQTVTQWLKAQAGKARQAIRDFARQYAGDAQHRWLARKLMEFVGSHV